jgi:hypothetical protein
MLTVQYNGPERTVGERVWYPGETREATAKQLAAWQAEHGDVFVVVRDDAPPEASDAPNKATDDAPAKQHGKKADK